MVEPAPDAEFLRGKQVAFTGRLASLTRAEAAQLVAANGGSYVATVNRQTALLIVGQDGWPLQKDGRLTNNLRQAQALQSAGHNITVLAEDELLTRLGM